VEAHSCSLEGVPSQCAGCDTKLGAGWCVWEGARVSPLTATPIRCNGTQQCATLFPCLRKPPLVVRAPVGSHSI